MSHCYFAFIFYSIADVFYIINFISLLHFILRRMCVCHMFNNVLTYLLTYLLTYHYDSAIHSMSTRNCVSLSGNKTAYMISLLVCFRDRDLLYLILAASTRQHQ